MNDDRADPFERRLEDDPRMVQVVDYLKRIAGFTVIRTSVAPHCGILYVFFRATDEALKGAVVLAGKLHSHINVGIDGGDGEVLYQMSVGNSFECRLEVLARHFGEVVSGG